MLVLGALIGEKASLMVMVSDSLVKEKNINATLIINEIAGEISGRRRRTTLSCICRRKESIRNY